MVTPTPWFNYLVKRNNGIKNKIINIHGKHADNKNCEWEKMKRFKKRRKILTLSFPNSPLPLA
jgi:hypothetical protein